jgi:hypothetical protein
VRANSGNSRDDPHLGPTASVTDRLMPAAEPRHHAFLIATGDLCVLDSSYPFRSSSAGLLIPREFFDLPVAAENQYASSRERRLEIERDERLPDYFARV